MKRFAAIAIAACALVLSAASSPAGAAAKHAAGFNCISACADYESTINQYFTDIAADSTNLVTTNVYSVAPQYTTPLTPSTPYSMTFDAGTNTYVDTNGYPATKCHDGFDKSCVTDKQIQAELANVIAAKGWPTHTTTALYFLFTPNNVGVCQTGGKAKNGAPCTTNVFCAYHHNAGQKFIYAVEPDDAAVSQGGCDTGSTPAGNNADSTLSTISHEQSEAITDPYGTAWTSDDAETYMGQPDAFLGSEIGDLCAWNFGDPLGTTLDTGQSYNQVINGDDYYLQQEYSNADGGCVQYAGGTPTNFDSSNPLYSGVGPLVNHLGPVMSSTTIYAIYWVPERPANSAVPKIAGKAAVGRKLKALHGVWSNAPTFAYQWLRCSAAGTSCKSIRKANASSYRLVPADAGHRIEIRIAGANQAGHTSATSAPTHTVQP